MERNYKVYKSIVIIVSLITLFITITFDKGIGYELIPLIPLTYLLCFMFFKKIHKYSEKYVGLFILNTIMFIKYILTSLFTVLSEDYYLAQYYVISVTRDSYFSGTILIIVEIVSIFLFIELFSTTIYKHDYNVNVKSKTYKPIKCSFFMYVFLSIILMMIVLFPNEFFSKSMIIFSKENSLTEIVESSNILSVLFYTFKLITTGILINYFIIQYQKKKKTIYIFFSYLIVGLFTFLNISTSRLNMIIPFVLFFVLTANIFKKKGIVFDIAIVTVLVIIFRVVSIYKNPWAYTENQTIFETILRFTKGFQYYTSGIAPNAIGLQCIKAYDNLLSPLTLINDIFGSVPVLSHFINQSDRIYTYYNMYALGGSSNSQLIPMSVSSIAYFNLLFAPLCVLLNVYLLMKIESLFQKKSDNYLDDYLNVYLYFIFASCIISNVQMLSGRFFVNYLPTFLVIWINRKLFPKIKITCKKN